LEEDQNFYIANMLEDDKFDFYYDYNFCNYFDLDMEHIYKKYNIDIDKLYDEVKYAYYNDPNSLKYLYYYTPNQMS